VTALRGCEPAAVILSSEGSAVSCELRATSFERAAMSEIEGGEVKSLAFELNG